MPVYSIPRKVMDELLQQQQQDSPDRDDDNAWQKWEEEYSDELARIDKIQAKGHSRHCACRQVWGDGECECDLYDLGYDPYAWTKQ